MNQYHETTREWAIRLTKEALADRETKKATIRTEWINRVLSNDTALELNRKTS